jgi:hypothetical protein
MSSARKRKNQIQALRDEAMTTKPPITLDELEAMARAGMREAHLQKRRMSKQPVAPVSTEWKFSSLKPFDRSTFDYDAYCAALDSQLKQ